MMVNPIVTDADDVQGVEADASPVLPVVPVRVEGVTRVQQLPSRLGDARTVKVLPAGSVLAHSSGDTTTRINVNPRRRRLILLSTDQPFYYGMEQESVERGTAAIWPINVPLAIEHTDQFFLASANVAGSTISIIREDWSL
jgi:hypothetical protein